ncbi:hypothetical protein EPH_0065050 [Eimeria praecox]|uniref:Uncharacterized protein n=1 Tax=Eimeria praecox TaxID=51316 RepID=U6H4R5_9EIME|nr:hypothetical protein EPH_0065050 [Eimeria praecox]
MCLEIEWFVKQQDERPHILAASGVQQQGYPSVVRWEYARYEAPLHRCISAEGHSMPSGNIVGWAASPLTVASGLQAMLVLGLRILLVKYSRWHVMPSAVEQFIPGTLCLVHDAALQLQLVVCGYVNSKFN